MVLFPCKVVFYILMQLFSVQHKYTLKYNNFK